MAESLVALAEMALAGNIGADIDSTSTADLVTAGYWFAEASRSLYRQLYRTLVMAKKSRNCAAANYRMQVAVARLVQTNWHAKVEQLAGIPLTDLREASDSFFRDWMAT